MPELVPGKTVASRAPTLLVENRLDLGAWRFRLTVLDDEGNESAPADLVVTVTKEPVIGPTRPDVVVRPTVDPRLVVSPILRPR
jgi:hypothetical protein